ncbi:HDOD domain-containing protein [Fundidesulfovibrio butyratiphilus]
MPGEIERKIYVDTFFARQPIFDAKRKVFGYELLYRRDANATVADIRDKDAATLSVISTALVSSHADTLGRMVAIHFSHAAILSEMPLALPAQTTLAEVDPVFQASQALLKSLKTLRAQGYTLAVSGYRAGECDPALIGCVDIVFMDILGKSQAELSGQVLSLAGSERVLAAKRVEDQEAFNQAKRLGFTLFQGFFFEKPVLVPGRTIQTGKAARLSLLAALERPDMDVAALAQAIESDVSLSYRLLTFINSAAFGLRHKIHSIRHAVTMLGWRKMKRWLWMVVLSDITSKDKGSELSVVSAIRAKFLELTAHGHDPARFDPDAMFLMGLFSLLEPMLDTPMIELVSYLPLEKDIIDALCGHDNPFADWLKTAQCFETGEWGSLDALTRKLGLDTVKAASAYCEALVWAKSLYEQPD